MAADADGKRRTALFALCREQSAALWTDNLHDLAPEAFFNVKAEVSPKHPLPLAMFGMTVVAYVPTVAIFIYLILSGLEETHEETKIETRDKTGINGWDCTMVPKVRQCACPPADERVAVNV